MKTTSKKAASKKEPCRMPARSKKTMPTFSFSVAKQAFDAGPGKAKVLAEALVPVDGKPTKKIVIRNAGGKPLEEYYRWQFLYGLIHSGVRPMVKHYKKLS